MKEYDVLYCIKNYVYDECGESHRNYCRYMTHIHANDKKEAAEKFYSIFNPLSFMFHCEYVIENISRCGGSCDDE